MFVEQGAPLANIVVTVDFFDPLSNVPETSASNVILLAVVSV